MNSKRIAITLAATLVLSSATVVTAQPPPPQTKTWVGGTGNWSTGANWNGGTVPAAGDNVYIAPTDGVARTINYNVSAPSLYGLNVDLTGPGSNRTTFQMSSGTLTNVGFIIGNQGRATFNQSGGTHTHNDPNFDGAVGYNAGGNGVYNLSGTGTLSLAKDFYVGNIGTGAVNQSGGMVDIARDLWIGTSGGTGAFNQSGGTATIGRKFLLGASGGMGTLNIEAGGSVSSNESSIGWSAGSTGTATVTGAGSTWTTDGPWSGDSGDFAVGRDGTGTLTISEGGTVTNNLGIVGWFAGSTGTAIVTGAGSTWNNLQHIAVGYFGSGELTIIGGATVSNGIGNIGAGVGSTGAVTVDGVGSTWNNTNVLRLGSSGTGTLTISEGGTVTSNRGIVGWLAGSTGTAIVTGAGSTWTMTGRLSLGGDAFTGANGGTGTLHIQPGGTVSVAQDTVLFRDGLVRLEGGTLATTAFDFRSGGQFQWTSGTLHVDTFNGNLTNPNGGTLAPGRSAGNTTILGNYTQQAGAALEIEIGGTGTATQYDFVNVTGTALVDGELELRLINGFVPSAVQTFVILNAASLLGVFDNVVNNQRVTTADGIGSFLVHYGPASQFNPNQIRLTDFELANPGGLPGDYNQDGTVDAADYVVWRDGLGGTYTQTDYDVWKNNFGATAGDGSGTNTAVPEPATLALLILGAPFVARRAHRLFFVGVGQ